MLRAQHLTLTAACSGLLVCFHSSSQGLHGFAKAALSFSAQSRHCDTSAPHAALHRALPAAKHPERVGNEELYTLFFARPQSQAGELAVTFSFSASQPTIGSNEAHRSETLVFIMMKRRR